MAETNIVSRLYGDGTPSSITGNGIKDILSRQMITGFIGGSVYNLLWSELSNMLNTVLGLNIGNSPSFNDRMYGYMFRLMAINKFEKELTLAATAQGAYSNGNPDGLPLGALFPLYANVVSDYPAFVRGAEGNEINGVDSTRVNIEGPSGRNETKNLYPDDLGIGTFENAYNKFSLSGKWNFDGGNRNSILEKTKKLFDAHKINSLISRFGTKADGENDIEFVGKTGYKDLGMSRGKNLRRAGSDRYEINGYNNPYCRVWTHHYQYDRFDRAIRPFSSQTLLYSPNSPLSPSSLIPDTRQVTMEKLHTWDNENFEFKEGDGEWGWKNNNTEWSHSVLNQQDGVVNITPKYDEKGTIHTKDCMFSIENLAWKDYNPYEFENALSWEQRGPLGGRIMWFPPYGIQFTETTNVQWNENVFIGRGESVYSYSNTTRSGTLSFMMLTDHPSITDYVSWSTENDNSVDDDMWNRFFAGCDSLDGKNDKNSILNHVIPTPMDYVFEERDNEAPEQGSNQTSNDENAPSDNVDEVNFFVFFPNNYSGSYDDPDFAIGYLLAGSGAQRNFSLDNPAEDIPISFKNFSEDTINLNIGYEMDSGGISSDSETNIIKGCINKAIGNNGWAGYAVGDSYQYDDNKIWKYRIDGNYEIPRNEDEIWRNNYAQTLTTSGGRCAYADNTGFRLNVSIDNQNGHDFCNNANLYSFVEVAYAIAVRENYNIKDYLRTFVTREDKIETLKQLLNNNIESVKVSGYANSQGHTPANEKLCNSRCETMMKWLCEVLDCTNTEKGETVEHNVTDINECSLEAKLWRSAKCTIRFKTDEESNNNDGEEYEQVSESSTEKIAKETSTPYAKVTETLKQNGFNVEGADDNDINRMYAMYKKENDRVKKGKKSGLNKIRYDNEMFFYRKFQKDNPFKWQKLNNKLHYFNPAFHSMTPEGFNMRTTFLQQCTRQGDTMSASDAQGNIRTANNMSFGRPPFCVLRLGDYINQMIVIRTLNIVYDEDGSLTWDLNDEGIGVQPMIARVTISFDFIGGSDLAGAVRRLQNAMSFNYYANASLYDNRADRMYYESEEHLSTAMGGLPENREPSLPEYGSEGRILNRKGTYTVMHSISKNDSKETSDSKDKSNN